MGAGGGAGHEYRGWGGLQMAGHQDCPVAVQEADRHGPGLGVDTPRKWVVLGGESPRVSSCVNLYYQGHGADAFQRPLRSRFQVRLMPGVDMTSDV
jgi:hypothetical protein